MKKHEAFVLLLLITSLLSPDSHAQSQEAVNVLLFTADDLDKLSLGCYGSTVKDISPNIDKLAAEGIRFNRAFVNNSICQPSRGILATGLYGHNSGVMGFMKMPPENNHPLIMEIMRKHGYQVGVLSKVNHSTPKASFEWDFMKAESDLGFGRNPDLYYVHAKAFFELCKQQNKPFYFMVNSNDPHRPFFVPGQELERGMALPSHIYSPEEVPVPGFLPDLPDVRKEVSYYYNSVKRLDDTFGKVMQALEESGLKDNTLVIFMSDNGMALPFAKCDNYLASSRTPWIVRWPGVISAGTVDDEHLLSEVDYFPSILEATGIKTETKMDGVSRLGLYRGENQESDSYVFTQIDNKSGGNPAPLRSTASPMRAVQSHEFIYIFNAWSFSNAIYYNNNEGRTMQAMEEAARNDRAVAERIDIFRHRPMEEFYDIGRDPDCLKNRISESDYSGEINNLRTQLMQWMQKTNDPLLYVFENRSSEEKVKKELYKLYPDLQGVDQETD